MTYIIFAYSLTLPLPLLFLLSSIKVASTLPLLPLLMASLLIYGQILHHAILIFTPSLSFFFYSSPNDIKMIFYFYKPLFTKHIYTYIKTSFDLCSVHLTCNIVLSKRLCVLKDIMISFSSSINVNLVFFLFKNFSNSLVKRKKRC